MSYKYKISKSDLVFRSINNIEIVYPHCKSRFAYLSGLKGCVLQQGEYHWVQEQYNSRLRLLSFDIMKPLNINITKAFIDAEERLQNFIKAPPIDDCEVILDIMTECIDDKSFREVKLVIQNAIVKWDSIAEDKFTISNVSIEQVPTFFEYKFIDLD